MGALYLLIGIVFSAKHYTFLHALTLKTPKFETVKETGIN